MSNKQSRQTAIITNKPEIPNAETIAAMEEGERIARDPNVKGYTVEEFFEEAKHW